MSGQRLSQLHRIILRSARPALGIGRWLAFQNVSDRYHENTGGAAMARKLIDISVPLQNDVPADPPGINPRIQYNDHQQSLPQMLGFFAGLKAEDLPDGQGWAMETVQLSTHNGTHLDAPYHYHPTMNHGERAWTIDEVRLDWCLQPGVKPDFRHLPDGYVATAADVEREFKRIGHTLSPLEIVVVNTSAGAKYGRPDYVNSGCGMGYEATMYLLERGVRLAGIDGWSWDAPFVYTAKKYVATRDASLIGKATRPGVIPATAISKSCTIWSFCRRRVSPCRAFRSRSNGPPRAGLVRSRLSTVRRAREIWARSASRDHSALTVRICIAGCAVCVGAISGAMKASANSA
jgi:kynurenine formamidase